MINFIIIRMDSHTYTLKKIGRIKSLTLSLPIKRRFDFYTLRNLMLQVRVSSNFSLAPDLIILHILYIY